MAGRAITIRKATPEVVRITWSDGTHVDVLFYAKGDAKSQVSIDHHRRPDDGADAFLWRERLAAAGGVTSWIRADCDARKPSSFLMSRWIGGCVCVGTLGAAGRGDRGGHGVQP